MLMADDSGAPLKSLGRHIGVSVSSKASMVAWCPPLTNHSRQIAEVQPCLPCIAKQGEGCRSRKRDHPRADQ